MFKQEERSEQMSFIKWLRNNYPTVVTIISPIHKFAGTPKQQMIQARNRKLMGYISGTLDLFIPLPLNGFHGLFIELKRLDGGSKQDNQIEMAKLLNKLGYKAVFCNGFEEAKKEFLKYIK